jgi:hypothetical protein
MERPPLPCIESLKTRQGVHAVWKQSAAYAILKEEKNQNIKAVCDRPSLGDGEKKGYKYVEDAIAPADAQFMFELNKIVFGRKCLYTSTKPNKTEEELKRGELTHWADGPRRVIYKLTLQHFEELCAQTVRENARPPEDRAPYNVLLALVWAWELRTEDIACIIRIGVKSGMAIGTGTPAEFEGVEQWENSGPQMWHSDTNPLKNPLIATFYPLGPADQNENTNRTLRGSTHILECEHARYPSLSREDKKARKAYLHEVWEKIKRESVDGAEGQFKVSDYEKQGQFREILEDGLTLVEFASTGTSTVYFSTGHIHRGGQTLVHSFGIFLAWKRDSDDISTDGLPVSVENYREELQGSSDDDDSNDVENLPSHDELLSQAVQLHGEKRDEIEVLPSYQEKLSHLVRKQCTKFDSYWSRCSSKLIVAGKHAYGELSAGTAAKIWDAVHTHIGIKSTDYALDHGCGQGKFLHSRNFFCPIRDLKLVGMEKNYTIYKTSVSILIDHPLEKAELKFGDSAEEKDWSPVTIAYGYEGGPPQDLHVDHKTIMLALLRTATLRALFSTKMNLSLFLDYIDQEADGRDIAKKWVLVKMPQLRFGNNSIQVGNCYHCCQCIILF